MKKIIILLCIALLSLGFVGCGSNQSTQSDQSPKPKLYGPGEEAIILDDNGKEMYSLKIDNIKTDNEYIYKSESKFDDSAQIVAVTYTYKNIAKADERLVEISADNLILADMTGTIALASNQYMKGLPKPIPVGTNLTIECHYGLKNKTDKVKISFSSETYKKSGTITFEIPVLK